jgi:hypothetical protein
MPDRIVTDGPLTADDLRSVVAEAVAYPRLPAGLDRDRADRAIDALADLTGTDRGGVAAALRMFRSNLCGAADVLPHVEAEVDRLRVMVGRLQGELNVIRDLLGLQPGEQICGAPSQGLRLDAEPPHICLRPSGHRSEVGTWHRGIGETWSG